MPMSVVLVMLLQLVSFQIPAIIQPTFFIVAIFHYGKGPLADSGHAAPVDALILQTEDEK